jgi:cytochrome c biogenesis protein CcmG/thiol:disulfide interchange protein DsbE
VVVVAAAVVTQLGNGGRARVGEPVPPIVGQTIDGERFDLASLRGRPVVVNFWASWCIPCRTEFPLLIAKEAEHAADGLAIVGPLYEDALEPARAFRDESGATWPMVVDPGGAFARDYRVAAPPQTYFIDRDGILRSIQIGELTEEEFDRQYAAISS